MRSRPPPPDLHLWHRETDTVKPLRRSAQRVPAPVIMPRPQVRPAGPERDLSGRAGEPGGAGRPAGPPATDRTLDRTWDRKLGSGAVAPDLIVDLHGYSQERAHLVLVQALERAWHRHHRIVLVVTGKGRPADDGTGRGVLRGSLPGWLDAPALRDRVAALRPAHPRHGGAGAWYVVLRRRREAP